MKKLILGITAFTALLFTGCLQNFKDSVLVIENNTSGQLRFDFRGEKYDIASGQTTTIEKIDPDNYAYSVVVTNIPVPAGVTLAMTNPNGNLDFKTNGRGWKIRMNVQGILSATADSTGKVTGTYTVSTMSTGGWADEF